tara:strand:- start:997 stop:1641 length:645 start_codon:yes stop_codon:yes gene_type:complete
MIFFDLDGPLLDVTDRYYSIYHEILNGAGFKTISKNSYWDAKRNKIPEHEIIKLTTDKINYEDYKLKRLNNIERDNYLLLDKLQDGAKPILDELSNNKNLVLVTLRNSRTQLLKQLKHFGIYNYFESVLNTGKNIIPRWKMKYNLITDAYGKSLSPQYLIMGDTDTDIKAGKELGIATMGVSNGIRSKEILLQEDPDYCFESINDIDLTIFSNQ